QGKVSVNAKAGGLPTFPQNLRMGIVIAEDRVDVVGKNGVRVHEMVVRGMLGGPGGVPPTKEGVLEFSNEFELSKLRKHLAKTMTDKELEAETLFEAKPLALQALHVVSYLQNSETGEIYQATLTPITGLGAGDAEKSTQ
ncbi:MAG: hypothetical protein JSS02_16130, partial [Planctomycetes bacterium]|nr:hypothetical protein [Planctomycetota bacterium]